MNKRRKINTNVMKNLSLPPRPLIEIADDMVDSINANGTLGLLLTSTRLGPMQLDQIKTIYGSDGGVVLHDFETGLAIHFDETRAQRYVDEFSLEDQIAYRNMCKKQMVFVVEREDPDHVSTNVLKPI